jgi:hypothetical protein
MNRFQGIDSVSLYSLAGRYNNPIPSRILAPINCSKIPALGGVEKDDIWVCTHKILLNKNIAMKKNPPGIRIHKHYNSSEGWPWFEHIQTN